ncbi:MAG TPA: thioesterase family protein [Anaerolineales bacterium]|nr:thioesterase family protein [Anaerolineales bacterium]
MPMEYTRKFRVRFYECDAYGHVNNSNYARYMQEAAFDASAAAGFGDKRYNEMNLLWLIRDTKIEYLRPLRYGDTAEVKTWVADFRRVRSKRMYEIRREGADELLARGETDWVLLDRETLRPLSVPEEMKQSFFPEGTPEKAPKRVPFPKPPQAPPGTVTIQREVAWEDVDPAQHVNNAKYFTFLEESGIYAAAQYGVSMHAYLEDGLGYVARETRIEYKQAAVLGDTIEITTFLSNLRSVSATRHFILRRQSDQELLAQAYVVWVFVDIHTGRPVRLPEDLTRQFAPHIAD